jgi:hypothetical protein
LLLGLTKFLLFDLEDYRLGGGDMINLLFYFLPKVGISSIILDSYFIGHIP